MSDGKGGDGLHIAIIGSGGAAMADFLAGLTQVHLEKPK